MDKLKLKGVSEFEYLPFIRDDGAKFLFNFCKEHKPLKVLEIGTFLGYSGSLILSAYENTQLVTVEISEENFKNAGENFKSAKLSSRVKQILGDAKDVICELEEKKEEFDLIFLDGPKGQYIRYYPTLKKLLKTGGYLIADNVYLHGMVNSKEYQIHKHRSMVLNLRAFLKTIQEDADISTTIYEIADGISVSKKIK